MSLVWLSYRNWQLIIDKELVMLFWRIVTYHLYYSLPSHSWRIVTIFKRRLATLVKRVAIRGQLKSWSIKRWMQKRRKGLCIGVRKGFFPPTDVRKNSYIVWRCIEREILILKTVSCRKLSGYKHRIGRNWSTSRFFECLGWYSYLG